MSDIHTRSRLSKGEVRQFLKRFFNLSNRYLQFSSHVTKDRMIKWDLKTGDINNVLHGGKVEKIQRDIEHDGWKYTLETKNIGVVFRIIRNDWIKIITVYRKRVK